MSTEVARKMYAEAEREPGTLKTPVLPSSRQQELHNITHHPFQPWCEACVLGRSRQNPHKSWPAEHEGDEVPDTVPDKPVVQIDYCYTFTRHRWQGQGDQAAQGDDQGQPEAEQQQHQQAEDGATEEIDYRDQFGLCLVAVESTTGWMQATPILEKGAASLKRVAEQLVRLTLQVSPGSAVVVQSDTEPSAKQVLNAVEACRAKLGLVTEKRWVPKASHASNGRVEKAIDSVRRNALTLKAFLESRVGGVIEGHRHIYLWLFRHSAFLYDRFHVSVRGGTPHEILQGRRYRGALVPFGEVVIFYKGSKCKGDLQWQRGVWVGINERNGANILSTAEGTYESRSIRRLPDEEKWSLSAVVNAKGFPWNYQGQGRRKRPLYTSMRAGVPLVPDHATLQELAQAAGRAAAESIAAGTQCRPMLMKPRRTPRHLLQAHPRRQQHPTTNRSKSNVINNNLLEPMLWQVAAG